MDFATPKSLTILITNVWLEGRGGSEAVVRDVALGMQRRGHRPIVYAPVLGAPAEELRSRGIPVVDDLRKVAEPPDVIHGQHFVQTAEAIIRFPKTAAVSMCHGATFWAERPPVFPQIQRYLAVDEACRDRLVQAEGIDPNRVELMFNSVNLLRIPPRPSPLAPRPASALAFTKTKAQVPILAEACARLGIAFDAFGQGVGRMTPDPERELVQHDIVFATARSAIEALCAGCAVVVCDERGLGGLVTTSNFDYFRRNNFGLRSLTRPVDADELFVELNKYDSEDAESVSIRSRADCDFEVMLDRLEKIYFDSFRSARNSPTEPSAYHSALQTFLFEALPRLPADPRWPWMEERDHLAADITRLDDELAQARRLRADAMQAADLHAAELESSVEELSVRLGEAHSERDRSQVQLEEAGRSQIRLQAELDDLRVRELAQAQHLHAEAMRAAELRAAELESSVDELSARLGEAASERGRIQAQLEEAGGSRIRLQAGLDDLRARLSTAEAGWRASALALDAARREFEAAREERDGLRTRTDELANGLSALKRIAFQSGSAVTTVTERSMSRRWVLKARRAAQRPDWPAAEYAYSRALRLNPLAAPIWVQYGHSLKEQGSFYAAAHAYDRALSLDPSDDETARHFNFTVARAQIAPALVSLIWPAARP